MSIFYLACPNDLGETGITRLNQVFYPWSDCTSNSDIQLELCDFKCEKCGAELKYGDLVLLEVT